jgi:hypothetical protein
MSNLNTFNSNPTLEDLLAYHKKDILLSLNCHALATIDSFDAATQTATVTINYTQTYQRKSSKPAKMGSSFYESVNVDYPPLVGCPVYVLGGGTASMTFPIKKGDQCSVLFNDRSLDEWYASGQKSPLRSGRLHSFSDGIVLVGLRSKLNPIANYDTTRATLRNGGAAVGVRGDTNKVLVTGTYPTNTDTLNSVLQELITAVNNLITATAAITVSGVDTGPGVSGPPVNAAAINAVSSTLSAISTKIGGFLE